MSVTITSDTAGFALDTEPMVSTLWHNVTEIVAFKRDLLTTDLICLAFHIDDGTVIETDEQMVGYAKFIDLVASQFELAPDWWSNVAFPAFQTSMATIWSSTA